MNNYNHVVNLTPSSNTTVYIGNIASDVVDEQLLETVFGEYGQIEEIRLQRSKGFAFLKFRSHEQAAKAIVSVHGRALGAKAVKCSWGKENSMGGSSTQNIQSSYNSYNQPYGQQYSYPPGYYNSYPYGYNQPNYPQYGYGYGETYGGREQYMSGGRDQYSGGRDQYGRDPYRDQYGGHVGPSSDPYSDQYGDGMTDSGMNSGGGGFSGRGRS